MKDCESCQEWSDYQLIISFDKHMDTLFKITHAGTFNTSIQSLQLIAQVAKSRPLIADRYYKTLYDSLIDPRLHTSSKQAMYLNLVFKSLKSDESLPRVMSFVKRLLQMLGLHQPPFICGALYLLGEVSWTTLLHADCSSSRLILV